MMGHPSFDPALLCLRGGWAAAGPETIRNIIEKMGAREVCVAYGLSEASPNVVCSTIIAIRPTCASPGRAKPHDGMEVRITQRDTGAALPAGETGEIEVRGWNVMRGYYKKPEETGQGARRPRAGCAPATSASSPPTAGCASSGGSRTSSGSAARTSRRPRSRRCCSRIPPVATAQVVGVPDPRLGEVGAAFVTLKAETPRDRGRTDRLVRERCANFRVPRYVAIVDELRRHRHDRERQGAEERAARACDPGIQASTQQAASTWERHDERRRPV